MIQISKAELENLYNKQNLKQKEIAKLLGVKMYEVQNALVKYGITKKVVPKNHFKHWTKEQDEFLISKFGVFSYETIGKYKLIDKSAESVKARACKLKLGDPRFHDDFVTKTFLARSIKVDAKKVNYWIESCGLKSEIKKLTLKSFVTRIRLSDFWEWLEKNKDLMNWKKFESGAIGVEPKWTKEIREKYKKATPKNEGKEWTNELDGLLDSYYKLGKSIKEIADLLGRSESAIDGRLSVICAERRKKRWTREEEVKVKEMLKEGKGTYEISVKLKRPYKSVEMFRTRYINANKSVTY